MSIKYLLNGRIASDIYHLRNLIDSWTEERKFPEIINDCNEIRKEDIVITTGYLGHSGKLIKKHDPKKILIIDNSIFPKRGIKNKRSRIFPTKLMKKLNPKIGITISMINA